LPEIIKMARVHAGACPVVLRIFVFFAPVAAVFEVAKNAILSDLTAHISCPQWLHIGGGGFVPCTTVIDRAL